MIRLLPRKEGPEESEFVENRTMAHTPIGLKNLPNVDLGMARHAQAMHAIVWQAFRLGIQ